MQSDEQKNRGEGINKVHTRKEHGVNEIGVNEMRQMQAASRSDVAKKQSRALLALSDNVNVRSTNKKGHEMMAW
ncbi:hypothetical protein EDS67_24870 [candidate division KSB1 bacterium]|nr:MAG: hypothetical protein EDS67_24870 [candidate division KSB1 bacterium]MBC6949380.1 hypothetical protein [candidate division KSB1 bacterium]MCE7944858.1 hypothetical protein [Chlorobi bacterium CHB1]